MQKSPALRGDSQYLNVPQIKPISHCPAGRRTNLGAHSRHSGLKMNTQFGVSLRVRITCLCHAVHLKPPARPIETALAHVEQATTHLILCNADQKLFFEHTRHCCRSLIHIRLQPTAAALSAVDCHRCKPNMQHDYGMLTWPHSWRSEDRHACGAAQKA